MRRIRNWATRHVTHLTKCDPIGNIGVSRDLSSGILAELKFMHIAKLYAGLSNGIEVKLKLLSALNAVHKLFNFGVINVTVLPRTCSLNCDENCRGTKSSN